MNVNSLYPYAREPMNETHQRLKVNAHEIAVRPVDPVENSPYEGSSQSNAHWARLNESLVEQNTLLYEYNSETLVLRTAEDMLGTFLDQKA